MKNFITLIVFFLYSLPNGEGWGGASSCCAQLTVTTAPPYNSPAYLVQNIFNGSGVTTSNVTYSGFATAIGFFNNGNTNPPFVNIGIDSGIVLSTGLAVGAAASLPNNNPIFSNATSGNTLDPDIILLQGVPGSIIRDAPILEFDFIPSSDTVRFDFVFASDEYDEYVGSSFNDVFGFFLSGPGITGPFTGGAVNLAVIPSTSTPISINTVNNGSPPICIGTTPCFQICQGVGPCMNCAYYIPSCNSANIQCDGLTTVLTAIYPVQCGLTYHIKIAVADVGDSFVDSWVFLKAKSFTSSIIASTSVINASCTALGSATVNVTGINPPYSYLWNPTATTTATATGLSAGTYTVTVTSGNGCTQTTTVSIVQAGGITAATASTPASCLSSNGTATATVSGGTSPYTYNWSNGQTTSAITGLLSGNYSVTVTDANGCTATQTVNVAQTGGPAVSLSNQTNILCNGSNNGSASVTASGGTSPYTYNWSNGQTTSSATGLSAGTYTATVTDASGCTQTQTVTITQPAAITASISATATTCGNNSGTATVSAGGGTGSFTYIWNPSGQTTSIATGLSATTYTVTVTDGNGCVQTATVSVTQTGGPTLSASSTPDTCNNSNGTAAAIAAGGNPPYTYLWSNGQTTSAITGLLSGNYSVTISDASGCTQTNTITVANTGSVIATAVSNVTITQGQSATLTASGGGTYLWSNGSTQNPITVSPPLTTIYCVTVTQNNCSDTACVTVAVKTEPIDCSTLSSVEDFFIPNAFSPNGDNENDVLKLYYGNIACIKTYKFIVYNRWGEKVFETEKPLDEWDGFFKGKIEGSAVFVWHMKAELITGVEIIKKGNASLIR